MCAKRALSLNRTCVYVCLMVSVCECMYISFVFVFCFLMTILQFILVLGSRTCCRCRRWGACTDILAYRMQLLHFWAGDNVDWADFGTLIGNHCVFAQTLDAHVTNQHGSAHGQYAHQRLRIHLDDGPCGSAGHAHQGYQNDSLHPVLNGKALIPLESGRSIKEALF